MISTLVIINPNWYSLILHTSLIGEVQNIVLHSVSRIIPLCTHVVPITVTATVFRWSKRTSRDKTVNPVEIS